jgi:hypothetical protein
VASGRGLPQLVRVGYLHVEALDANLPVISHGAQATSRAGRVRSGCRGQPLGTATDGDSERTDRRP